MNKCSDAGDTNSGSNPEIITKNIFEDYSITYIKLSNTNNIVINYKKHKTQNDNAEVTIIIEYNNNVNKNIIKKENIKTYMDLFLGSTQQQYKTTTEDNSITSIIDALKENGNDNNNDIEIYEMFKKQYDTYVDLYKKLNSNTTQTNTN
jgi:hypothetical protein